MPLVFYSFRVMFMLGVYFILFFRRGAFLRVPEETVRQTVVVPRDDVVGSAGLLASVSGWIVAEVDRQPWTIQDLLPVSASVSDIAPGPVKATFFIFLALFTVLLIARTDDHVQADQNRTKPAETAAENELTE